MHCPNPKAFTVFHLVTSRNWDTTGHQLNQALSNYNPATGADWLFKLALRQTGPIRSGVTRNSWAPAQIHKYRALPVPLPPFLSSSL